MKHAYIALIGLVVLAGQAEARSLSSVVAGVGLTPEDFTIMTETGRGLYEDGAARVGDRGEWTNPGSGSRGEVAVVAVESNCVRLRHRVTSGTGGAPREIRTRHCRTASGNWILDGQ